MMARSVWRWLGLTAFATVLCVFAWWPMLSSYPGTQTGDGSFYHQMIEATRVSVARYHEMPLWNPYQCGGIPLWDNPQSVAAAPLAWLAFIFGTTRAIEFWYVIHSIFGFFSMWMLARYEVRLSRVAALVAAASWVFAGAHTQHYSGGHLTFVPYLYFPLGIFLWRRAERDLRMATYLGMLVAFMMYEGGIYPLPHLAILLGAETLTRMWPAARIRSIVIAGVAVCVVAFVLGAPRFLPAMDQLRHHSRPLMGQEHDSLQWTTLKDVFLARSHAWSVPGQEYVWPEFGDYIGPILLFLAACGILVSGLERLWLLPLFVFSFSLMCGHFGELAPWHIIKGHIYPFKEMRVPSRFVMAVTLFLSLYAGIALDRIPSLFRRFQFTQNWEWRGKVRGALVALALIGVGDAISVGMTWCAQCFIGPEQKHVAASTRLFYGGSDAAAFIDQPAQNRGRLECWDEWGFDYVGAPLWGGDVPQARAKDDNAVVEVANRTQNTFTIDADVKAPTRILINSTFDRGWRADDGNVVGEGKQLALDLPAGHHHVRLKYWPHGLTLGLWLCGLGWVVLISYVIWRKRQQRTSPPQ